MLTLGAADAVEQLRDALAVGCTAAVLVEADAVALRAGRRRRAIADVVRAHEAAGTTYDLVLLGNDAADTGDFQVGIRLAYAARPAGRHRRLDAVASTGDRVDARGGRPRRGTEIFDVAAARGA